MKLIQRKTTPKVKDGKVQKKNRHNLTPSYWNTKQRIPVLDKEKPGQAHKHYLKKEHIAKFIQLLPDWDELAKDLQAIVLAEGGCEDGWFSEGVIGICAWPRDPRIIMDASYVKDHEAIFDRLGVKIEDQGNHFAGYFSESQIIAFQLLHIFLHELGHHHDRNSCDREKYAEEYAKKHEPNIWKDYIKVFKLE